MAVRLEHAFHELDGSDEFQVGIVTGSGSTFSAGADLRSLLGDTSEVPVAQEFMRVVLNPPDKTLIAAIEGFAVGGGFELALACDILVASDNASFGLPEVRHGVCAASGGLLRLSASLPRSEALLIALTGDFISASRAHALGLVNRLTEKGKALGEATRIALHIAENAPLAVSASRRVIIEAPTWSASEAMTQQTLIVEPVHASNDAREGMAAFLERRTPRWLGQ
jgi:enoyl-CoA hydratase